MRVTKRYIENWVNAKMVELEIPFCVKEVYKTRYTQDQYEGGASHFNISLHQINESERNPMLPLVNFYIFYPMWYMQQELNSGYEFYFKPKYIENNIYLQGSEIDLRRIN